MDYAILSQLHRIKERYDELTLEMGKPDVAANFEQLNALAKERADLSTLVELLGQLEAAQTEVEGSRTLLTEDDEEMRILAQAELTPVSIEKVNVPRIWSLVTCVKE